MLIGETCHFLFRGPESGPPPQARFSGKIPESGEDDFSRNLQGPTLQVETGGPLPLSRKWNDWFSSLFHLWALEKQVSG
ncbi:hypothetical protein M097_2903 [Phocaeicola vulgatus str. 3775 SL(B) 10 (iv)]|uniref:Uncharacterized protein n=1 Tax=Phocaeicola vulgatus str. 3775 SL(B) 10 (iv) TaxID=1339350 RepID=A0A078R2Z8_PHOVU|nr:hypothetical protein M097_2903 [Phocaeicola vulgatus str. 3775 SL(B) 10 (iv)]